MAEAATPVERTDPRRARTRAALIRAAQALLAEGRTAVSIQEITVTAGVGFGSFSNHFDDKDALWAAAVSDALRVHGDFVAALTDDVEDPAEVFCVGLRLTGRLQREHPDLARVLVNRGIAAVLSHRGGLLAHAQRDIQAAIDAGRFDVADAELAVHVTAGALLSVIALLDRRPDLDADAVADELAARMLRSFGLSAAEATDLVSQSLPAPANRAARTSGRGHAVDVERPSPAS